MGDLDKTYSYTKCCFCFEIINSTKEEYTSMSIELPHCNISFTYHCECGALRMNEEIHNRKETP